MVKASSEANISMQGSQTQGTTTKDGAAHSMLPTDQFLSGNSLGSNQRRVHSSAGA